ncbi:MAG: TIGR00159 family protein [Bacteroidetes bacterium]|nr:TIGR00159 family protein [Bacteroidota bacterium]
MIELFRIGFLSFTLVDLIDIGIVAVLFYAVYRVLRDTVAVQILLGLVLILGISFITEAVNLKSLNWILRAISDVWLIAFIILFQPELRRVLLIITRSRLFRLFIRTNIAETVDEVIDAAKELAEKHIGALIVFTRSQNVKMTIDTGIPLQAMVSKELLVSIFNPRSPLHDGAVIIENQLMIAARCVLPLSTTTKISSRNLGTRHRAALGICEQSDAVVLVISEETGGISIAHEGKLITDITIQRLPLLLAEHLSDEVIQPNN